MQKLIAIITLGLFCMLASYAYGRYTPEPIIKKHELIVWNSKKAAQLADVYGFTVINVDQPIRIWQTPTPTER